MDCKTQPIGGHELSDQRKVRQRCPSQDHVGQKWTKADMAQSEVFDFGAEKGTLTPVGGSVTDLQETPKPAPREGIYQNRRWCVELF